jgi:hypothetical protein
MLRLSKHIILILATIYYCNKTASAQQFQEGKVGINVGIILALGTHIDRFGVVVNSYYKTDHFQINPELRLYFNAKNLGPNKPSIESVLSLGVVYAYGKKDSSLNEFYNPTSNQTQHKNSVGYAYRFYLNNIETNQTTGTLIIQIANLSLISENDLFSGTPKLDRFRTAAFMLQYQKDKVQFGINTTLFTGQMGERITDENYPFVGIYENNVGGKYTQFSHGLLSAQFNYAGDSYQTYQANIGIDSERVRHTVQNRFAHDILVGHGINAHVPMLDDKGGQYLFKEGQRVKPIKFYMNAFANPSLFY